jgi:hypothetical protein
MLRSRFPLAALLVVSATLYADDAPGIHPRSDATDYPVHEIAAGATFGASALSKEQIKKGFATDLAGEYIVIEVALYPEKSSEFSLNPEDFLLKIGTSEDRIRPVDPQAIAASIERKNRPKPSSASDVTLYPTAQVGYESGPYGPNGRRAGGWTTGAGVGVGVGPSYPAPRPASTDRDRDVMRSELSDKSLPAGKVIRPVAGYLFFPVSPKKKPSGVYELTYHSDDVKTRLFVPPPHQ